MHTRTGIPPLKPVDLGAVFRYPPSVNDLGRAQSPNVVYEDVPLLARLRSQPLRAASAVLAVGLAAMGAVAGAYLALMRASVIRPWKPRGIPSPLAGSPSQIKAHA